MSSQLSPLLSQKKTNDEENTQLKQENESLKEIIHRIMKKKPIKKDDEKSDLIELAQPQRFLTASSISSRNTSPGSSINLKPSFDYVSPLDNVEKAIQIGIKKAHSTMSSRIYPDIFRIILKAMMSGAYLGFSISLTVHALSLGWDKISAALLFPTGFVMLILMGNDLATGNFALLPMAYLYGKYNNIKDGISIGMVLINWLVVYCGNFMGALMYLFILWGGMTHFGQAELQKYEEFKESLCNVTEDKVLRYQRTGGGAGWFAAVFDGILCNWMVTMGVLLSFSSRSTIGKIFAMYIPIAIFITLGFEHSIVNLFLLPAGLVYECDTYDFGEWWVWNQIPVTLGNMLAGIVLTGSIYFAIWSHKL